jgi:hypothetical protein
MEGGGWSWRWPSASKQWLEAAKAHWSARCLHRENKSFAIGLISHARLTRNRVKVSLDVTSLGGESAAEWPFAALGDTVPPI